MAYANRPRMKLTRMRVKKISLVKDPATGEDFLLYKAGQAAAADATKAEATATKKALSLDAMPELACYAPASAQADARRRIGYDSARVIGVLGSIGAGVAKP